MTVIIANRNKMYPIPGTTTHWVWLSGSADGVLGFCMGGTREFKIL